MYMYGSILQQEKSYLAFKNKRVKCPANRVSYSCSILQHNEG